MSNLCVLAFLLHLLFLYLNWYSPSYRHFLSKSAFVYIVISVLIYCNVSTFFNLDIPVTYDTDHIDLLYFLYNIKILVGLISIFIVFVMQGWRLRFLCVAEYLSDDSMESLWLLYNKYGVYVFFMINLLFYYFVPFVVCFGYLFTLVCFIVKQSFIYRLVSHFFSATYLFTLKILHTSICNPNNSVLVYVINYVLGYSLFFYIFLLRGKSYDDYIAVVKPFILLFVIWASIFFVSYFFPFIPRSIQLILDTILFALIDLSSEPSRSIFFHNLAWWCFENQSICLYYLSFLGLLFFVHEWLKLPLSRAWLPLSLLGWFLLTYVLIIYIFSVVFSFLFKITDVILYSVLFNLVCVFYITKKVSSFAVTVFTILININKIISIFSTICELTHYSFRTIFLYKVLLFPSIMFYILQTPDLTIPFFLVSRSFYYQQLLNVVCFFWPVLLFFFVVFTASSLISLIIVHSSFFFFGKRNSMVFFFKNLTLLFIVSVLIQIILSLSKTNSIVYISFDIKQTYVVFNTFLVSLFFDNLSLFFSTTTIQIAFFVNLFIHIYMRGDQKSERFFFLLNYFVFSMVLLLHSGTFILLFFFWELIGITSFFLINFYDQRCLTFKSAFKAFSFNRLSDVCLLIAIVIYYNNTGSFTLTHLNMISFYVNSTYYNMFFFKFTSLTLFLFFILVCSFCKSAQLGFHFWLPDSMEAPAPASALIHSATLVSAGLFLFLRFSVLFNFSVFFCDVIIVISSVTVLFGSVVSCVQSDLKRLLAYSTISNCGLMFVSSVLTDINNTLGLFYFHGLTKSISFLFVGLVIIIIKHQQDFRYIGCFNFFIKIILFGLVVSVLYLSCWPMSINCFFKHNSIFYPFNTNYQTVVQSILVLSSSFSYIYSMRLFFYLYFANVKSAKSIDVDMFFFKKVIFLFYSFFLFMLLMFFVKYYGSNSITPSLNTIVHIVYNTIFYKFMLFVFILTLGYSVVILNDDSVKTEPFKKVIFISVLVWFIF